MSDFTPIDHKESEVDYVELVRNSVAKRLKTTLEDIEDASFLVGCWRSSLSRRPESEYDCEHMPDGTIATPEGSTDEHSS